MTRPARNSTIGALLLVLFVGCGSRSPLLAAADPDAGSSGPASGGASGTVATGGIAGTATAGGSGGAGALGGSAQGGISGATSTGGTSGAPSAGGASSSGGSAGSVGACAELNSTCGSSEPCCPDLECSPQNRCRRACASAGRLCSGTRPCCAGSFCVNGKCQAGCGVQGQSCSSALPCCTGFDCASDGTCHDLRTCAEIQSDVVTFFSEHQSCSTDSNCTETSIPDGPNVPGDFCCWIPISSGTDLAPYDRLMVEWNALACGSKACCDADAAPPRCISGRCTY